MENLSGIYLFAFSNADKIKFTSEKNDISYWRDKLIKKKKYAIAGRKIKNFFGFGNEEEERMLEAARKLVWDLKEMRDKYPDGRWGIDIDNFELTGHYTSLSYLKDRIKKYPSNVILQDAYNKLLKEKQEEQDLTN